MKEEVINVDKMAGKQIDGIIYEEDDENGNFNYVFFVMDFRVNCAVIARCDVFGSDELKIRFVNLWSFCLAGFEGHPKAIYTCQICARTYTHPRSYGRHLRVHMPNMKRHQCPYCRRIYDRKDHCIIHIRTHHGEFQERLYPCPFCEKVYRSPATLYQHKNIHMKKYECKVCGMCSASKYKFDRHMNTHVLKGYQCPRCAEWFGRKGRLCRVGWLGEVLFRAVKTGKGSLIGWWKSSPLFPADVDFYRSVPSYSSGRLSFKCPECNFTARSTFLLQSHRRFHLPTEARDTESTCDSCGRHFGSKQAMLNHRHVHSERFKCNICGYCSASNASLNKHMTIHKEKKWCCIASGRFAVSDVQINGYQGRVGGPRGAKNVARRPGIYRCALCPKSYPSRTSLIHHSYIHSERFKCATCGKCWDSNIALQRHARRHMGVPCPVCVRKFPDAESIGVCIFVLCRFLIGDCGGLETDDRQFRCSFCPRSYKTRTALLQHGNVHLESFSIPFHTINCLALMQSAGNDEEKKMRVLKWIFKCSCVADISAKPNSSDKESEMDDGKCYSCGACGHKAFNEAALKLHKKLHLSKCYCQICNYWFHNRKELESHFLARHSKMKLNPQQKLVVAYKRTNFEFFFFSGFG
uniref:C2H2-type domain-containing protein n=1 Tax=Strigamia maritima TaxID=126957 RepID=T1IP22_STRMM